MKQNVRSIEFGQYDTHRSSDGQKYEHTLDLKLFVNTDKLCETPRSYVWRHMSQDTWTLQDESEITMTRIHVKRRSLVPYYYVLFTSEPIAIVFEIKTNNKLMYCNAKNSNSIHSGIHRTLQAK